MWDFIKDVFKAIKYLIGFTGESVKAIGSGLEALNKEMEEFNQRWYWQGTLQELFDEMVKGTITTYRLVDINYYHRIYSLGFEVVGSFNDDFKGKCYVIHYKTKWFIFQLDRSEKEYCQVVCWNFNPVKSKNKKIK